MHIWPPKQYVLILEHDYVEVNSLVSYYLTEDNSFYDCLSVVQQVAKEFSPSPFPELATQNSPSKIANTPLLFYNMICNVSNFVFLPRQKSRLF